MRLNKDNVEKVLVEGFSGSLADLASACGMSAATTKRHLNTLISANPDFLKQVTGFTPDAQILVDFAEKTLGKINSAMLMDANRATKELIDGISKPELRRQFELGIAPFMQGAEVRTSVDSLFNYISEEFLTYVTETGNGFVSVVGRLNEEIILRALRNSSLSEGADFQRTGNKSDGDIIVSQRTGTKKNLYIEVKSYHARERLLRGLQDIPHPEKVGIGFFRDPSEFNPQRTQTLINSNAWAIYIPEDTYSEITDVAKSMTTSRQDRFYRPTAMFVDDMIHYCGSGQIKPFRS